MAKANGSAVGRRDDDKAKDPAVGGGGDGAGGASSRWRRPRRPTQRLKAREKAAALLVEVVFVSFAPAAGIK
eukprot:7173923-Lingulodinium_polyedra.AAC.1